MIDWTFYQSKTCPDGPLLRSTVYLGPVPHFYRAVAEDVNVYILSHSKH